MKGKNIIRIIILTLLLFFIGIYVMQAMGYYEYSNKKTNILTEEAAKKFEKDLKEGKNVDANQYLKEENDYNNRLSKGGMWLSSFIEKSFDSIMGFLFNEINGAINS